MCLGKKNLLEMKPRRRENIDWQEDEDGNLTLIIKRNGWIDRIFQKVFKTPKQTTLELDKVGSFVWLECDGNQDLNQIAKKLKKTNILKKQPQFMIGWSLL